MLCAKLQTEIAGRTTCRTFNGNIELPQWKWREHKLCGCLLSTADGERGWWGGGRVAWHVESLWRRAKNTCHGCLADIWATFKRNGNEFYAEVPKSTALIKIVTTVRHKQQLTHRGTDMHAYTQIQIHIYIYIYIYTVTCIYTCVHAWICVCLQHTCTYMLLLASQGGQQICVHYLRVAGILC